MVIYYSYYSTINLFRCGAGDSVLLLFNCAQLSSRDSCQRALPEYFGDHSHKLCITPVTQHQTMEILSVMTSVSPNSQTKGPNSRPPKKHTWTMPLTHHSCLSAAKSGGGLWWHPWVEKHMTVPDLISHSVAKQHSLLRNNLIICRPAVLWLQKHQRVNLVMVRSLIERVTSVGCSSTVSVREAVISTVWRLEILKFCKHIHVPHQDDS